MKKRIMAIMTVMFVGCSIYYVSNAMATAGIKLAEETSLGETDMKALAEKARCGDGQACLRLADCYRKGIGVKKSLMGTVVMSLRASLYGATKSDDEYFASLPEDDEYRICYNLLEKYGASQEDCSSAIKRLEASEDPDVMATCGVSLARLGDAEKGMALVEKAEKRGSTLAIMLKYADKDSLTDSDKSLLEEKAEALPSLYNLLGQAYLTADKDGKTDYKKAASYYMKAEEQGMLDMIGARWLLNCHEKGMDIQLTEEDVKRLKAFVSKSKASDD